MEKKNLSVKLNELYEKFCGKNPALNPLVRFYRGESAKKLNEAASVFAPSGTVVVLFTEKAGEELVKNTVEALRGACLKILTVKISEKKDAVSAAAEILCAAEDARLMVAAEYSLVTLAKYAAKISGLPLVYLMRTAEADGLLSPRLFLKNGSRTDCFFADAKIRIIIDDEAIIASCRGDEKKASAELFARLMSKIPALADYRARLSLEKTKPNAEAYGLLRSAVKEGYTAFAKKEKEAFAELIYQSFAAEIADLISGGELCGYSALRFAEFLLAGEKRLSAADALELYARISGIYALYTSPLAAGLLDIPDYRERAHELAELTGTEENIFLEGLLRQAEKFDKLGENADNITDSLAEELKKQNSSAVSVRSTFIAYSHFSDNSQVSGGAKQNSGADDGAGKGAKTAVGEKTEGAERAESKLDGQKLNVAIKLAGDSPFAPNAMSFAREKGVTELI